eukprot:EG_transcript_775
MWGLNSYRQLGFSDQGPRYTPTTLPLPNNEQIQCVVMGGYHSAVQTVTGQWYSFGRNDQGQLGLGHASITTTAMAIPPINGSPVVDVLLGDWFSFLQTAAGVWYGVGYNDPGMLGLNYTLSRVLVPTAVILTNILVAKMVLGFYTVGVIATNGCLFMMGMNLYGQLGINNTLTPYTTPQRTLLLSNVTSLALGIYHSVAIANSGKYYAWGLNRVGQLGTGDLNTKVVPTLVTPPNGRPVVRIVSGYATVAFLTDDGTWYMSGANQYGQLGDLSLGSAVSTPTPFPLLGNQKVVRMAAGQYHWAGVTENGSWYVWGYNYDGELGLGTTDDVNTPRLFTMPDRETLHEIALGGFHSAALRSATYTPTLTPTATPVQCPGSKQFATDSLAITLDTPCRSVYQGPGSPTSGNVGSDSLFDRYLMVNIHSVQSGYTLEVDLLTGCQPPNASCLATFTSSSAQSTTYLPVGPTPRVLLAVGLHATTAIATASRRSGDAGTSAELSMAYKGSVLLLGVTCSLTALAMLLLWAGLWWGYWVRRERQRVKSPTRRRLALHTQFAKALCTVLLALGAWCLTVGVWWLIIGLLTTKPLSLQPALLLTGACLAGIGAVLIVCCGLYLLRDPVAVKCPECDKPVSRWKFRGTYLLTSGIEDNSPFSKAHTAHVRCQLCKQPVVQDRWPASAPCRPYHRDCWETFCSKAVLDRQYFTTWWERSQSQASKVELVHMLAMAITTKEFEAVERFAQLDPKLIFTPVLLSGMRTPVQLAALFGHRDVVEMLLQRGQQRTLDATSPIHPSTPKSMRIYSLEKEDNDLYLYQPQVLYNDQPVFVGHTNGKYVYYYEPCPEPGDRQYAAGWCLSPYLGSGRCPFRLKLEEAISDKVATKSGSSNDEEGYHASLLQRLKSWLLQKGTKRAPKAKEMLFSGDESSWSGTLRPPTATMVPAQKTVDVQVDWVPHATSLLLDAIASGNQATIQFVLHLYHRQDQGCLKWQYRTRQGLWEAYPPAEQKALHTAAALRMAEATPGGEDDPRTVVFEEREEVCGDERRPIRYTMQAIIQFTRKGLTVSSNVDSVWEWDGCCVVFAPSHAAAAAPDEETLAFLVEEGVVDYGLWSPPCHVSAAWRVLGEGYIPVLKNVMAEELRVALGDACVLPATVSTLFHTRGTGTRSGSQRAESRLTDGLTSTPQSDAHLAFYAPTYSSPTWSLPFCAALPANEQGFVFHEDLILEMALDALKKGHELRRQGCPQPLRHALALFVYTYEMLTDDHTDQIYIC